MMSLIKPFAALRAPADLVADVIAPPYDVISSVEAKQFAANKPSNILHVSKAQIDLADDADPHAAPTHEKARQNLMTLLHQQTLSQDLQDCYYAYQLSSNTHSQTGIIAAVSVAAYNDNLVCKHELTQPKKQRDRAQLMIETKVQTGPVILAYQQHQALDELIAQTTQSTPDVDIVDHDQVQHRLWVISNPTIIDKISALVNSIGKLYIADGHHRCAAAAYTAEQLKTPESQHILAALFPHSRLKILGYHRVIKDEQFNIDMLTDKFNVKKMNHPFEPSNTREFGLYHQHQWYRITIDDSDNENVLDAELLNTLIIQPIFHIDNIQQDPRIDFMGGQNALINIVERVDSGAANIGITLAPTTMEQIMTVADNNGTMPTKSTWFEPKMADGLVLMTLGEL